MFIYKKQIVSIKQPTNFWKVAGKDSSYKQKHALKLTDDVAGKFDDAYRATKGKIAELANKVDDALAPGMVTTEDVVVKPTQVKGSDVLKMRANKITSSNRRFEEMMQHFHL